MTNEFYVNLVFPENLEMSLSIGKSKKVKFSSLCYNGNKLKSIETSLLPENYNDGDSIKVFLKNNFITDENGVAIISIGNSLADNGTLVDLVKEGNVVKVLFSDILLDTKDVSYFGTLFDKKVNYNCNERLNYKAFVNSPSTIKVVRYANTHQHTEYSRLDGMTKLKDIAKKTEWAGAITDHGVMTGVLKFDSLMRENGKKPIIGMEGYIERINEDIYNDIFTDTNRDDYKINLKKEHIILLAKNNVGYKNLVKLASLSWNNFYGKNHIVYSDLVKYSEGIVATSACLGSTLGKTLLEDEKRIRETFFEELGIKTFTVKAEIETDFDLLQDDDLVLSNEEKALLKEKFDLDLEIITKDKIEELIDEKSFPKTKEELSSYGKTARLYISKMIEIFGREDFYIEIQRHNFASEIYVEKILLELAKEYNLKIVTGIDNHYLNKEDAPIHEMWLCEATKKSLTDPTRMKFPGEGYWLMTSDEVLERFGDIPEALDNSLEIAEKCNVDLKVKGYSLPKYPLPEGYDDSKESQVKYFKKMVFDGYKNRFLGTDKYNDPIYTDRMSFEIKTILNMGFESYFLIVQDYIAWAKDKNVSENIEKYFPKRYYDLNSIPEAIKNKTDEIYVGPGRGSAAGSLVAYCLGITNINPIEYNLLFERFLNPDRISMPK